MEQRRMDPQSLQLRALVLSRPVSAELRAQLAAGLFTTVLCNFGITEILDPGLTLECESGRMHVQEDQFLPEIHDGELVVTTLGREALPLLRYRTRVSAALLREKCPCGRTGAILEPGPRLGHQHRVNEIEFYERQVCEALQQTPAAGNAVTLEITERRLILKVQMSKNLFADTLSFPAEFKRQIESEILTRLGIESEVQFMQPPPPPSSD
jgi:phenylacetate-CoA ligase